MKVSLDRFSIEIDDNNSTAKISISPQANGNVVIPRTVKYGSKEYLIIGINDDAFRNNVHVRGIIFPRDSAIKVISQFAFCGTSIDEIILPASVEQICEGAFSDCNSLRKISFDKGSNLKTIEKDAFSWSSLSYLSLPEKVDDLRDGWCNGTSGLVGFDVSPENQMFSCIGNDFLVGKSKRQQNDFDLLYFARRNIEKAIIPSNIKRICSFAFHRCCQLKSVQFSPDSKLRSIDQYAFSWAYLEKISIPDHVKKIQQFAFSECPELKTVEFSDKSKLHIIKEYAFSSSSIESIKIPSHVKLIGKNAFSWCNHLATIDFSDNSQLRSFDKNLFHRTGIESIVIPARINKIGEGAFSECMNLKNIIFPENSKLKSIEKKAFFGTSLQNIAIPSKLAQLKDGWCWGTTKIFNVQIPSKNKHFEIINNDFMVTKSEDKVNGFNIIFARKDIEYGVIPTNIKKIGAYAFDQCEKLKTITFKPEKFVNNFSSKQSTEEEEEEKDECKKIVSPEEIDDNAFWGCSNLQSTEFQGDQISIGKSCFSSCQNLKAISLPNASIFSINQDSLNNVPFGCSLFVKAKAELVYN